MNFDNDKPIYLQLAGYVEEQILHQEWQAGHRIPSVRDMATEVGVNPNTVARTFSHLQDQEIIYNQRGIGYFVHEDARSKVLAERRRIFVEEQLPEIVRTMELLGISFTDLPLLYEKNNHQHETD